MYKSFKSLILFLALCSTATAATIDDSSFSATTNYAESVTFNLTSDHSYTGVVSGTGNTLTKTGAGVLTLGTTQTYTGATSISGGTISISNVSYLANTSGITLSNGGTLKYASTTAASLSKTITVNGTGTVDFHQATTNTLTLNIAGDENAVLTLYGNTNKTGSGSVSTFTLNASNFTGTVKVTGGKYRTDSTGSISKVVLDGGTLMDNSANDSNIAAAIELGTNGGSLRSGHLGSSKLILNGKVSGTGSLSITGDQGNIYLSNSANDFSGGIKIGDTFNGSAETAKLYLGADNALGTGVVSFSCASDKNFLDLNGHSVTTTAIGGLSSTFTNSIIKNTSSTASTLTLNVADSKSYSYVGNLTGKINLVKGGAGTQILGENALAYTGTTTVTGGTLKLPDGVNAQSAVNLNGGTYSVNTSSGITFTVQKDGGGLDWRASGTTGISVKLVGDGTTADTVFTFNGINQDSTNCNTLNISSISNYSGKIRITAGKWNVTNSNQLPSGSIILDGGTLMLNNSSSITVANAIQVNSASTLRAGSNGTHKLTGLTVQVNSVFLRRTERSFSRTVPTHSPVV